MPIERPAVTGGDLITCPTCGNEYDSNDNAECFKRVEEHYSERQPSAFIVLVFGYWGRGRTLKEAAQNCAKQGATAKDRAIARLIVGDDKPEVNGCGDIVRASGSVNHTIGNGFKLGALLKLEGE